MFLVWSSPQVCLACCRPERSWSPCCLWSSSPAQPSMLPLTMDRYHTHTSTHTHTHYTHTHTHHTHKHTYTNTPHICTHTSAHIHTHTPAPTCPDGSSPPQFDRCAWVPNTPRTMRQPPPTDKDAVTMGLIMDTLPDISQSCVEMAITWHLGRAQPDAVRDFHHQIHRFTKT